MEYTSQKVAICSIWTACPCFLALKQGYITHKESGIKRILYAKISYHYIFFHRIHFRNNHTIAGTGVDVDVIDPNPSPAHNLQLGCFFQQLWRDFGRRAHGQAVVLRDDVQQLFRRQFARYSDIAPHVFKGLNGLCGQGIGNQNFGFRAHAAFSLDAKVSMYCVAKAHSNHGMSASMLLASTVEPPQMRKPAGASR